jgi:hypothetical protein
LDTSLHSVQLSGAIQGKEQGKGSGLAVMLVKLGVAGGVIVSRLASGQVEDSGGVRPYRIVFDAGL